MRLTEQQKRDIRQTLINLCDGTPLQIYAGFVSTYIGTYIISLVENRDEVFKENNKDGNKRSLTR